MGAANRALVEHLVSEVVTAGPAKRLQLATLLMSPGESKARGRSKNTKTASERELLADRMEALAATLRDLGVAAASADEALLSRAPSMALAAVARTFEATRLTNAFDATERARHALERNVSPKTVADWLLMQV